MSAQPAEGAFRFERHYVSSGNAVRYHIPGPVKQHGPTCWYATTYNMLKYWNFPEELEDFGDFMNRPPDGVTPTDWKWVEQVSPTEWAWLREFSVKGKKIGGRYTLILNMMIANRRVPFSIKATWGEEIFASKGQLLIDAANKGPFLLGVLTYPWLNQTTVWNSTMWGRLKNEKGHKYRLNTAAKIPAHQFKGGSHAYLCVGYIQRDVQQLRMQQVLGSPEWGYFMGTEFNGTGKTLELLLLNPQEPTIPTISDHDSNDLLLIDYHHLQSANHLQKKYGIKRKDLPYNIVQMIELTPNKI